MEGVIEKPMHPEELNIKELGGILSSPSNMCQAERGSLQDACCSWLLDHQGANSNAATLCSQSAKALEVAPTANSKEQQTKATANTQLSVKIILLSVVCESRPGSKREPVSSGVPPPGSYRGQPGPCSPVTKTQKHERPSDVQSMNGANAFSWQQGSP